MLPEIRIGLAGFGTVGQGLARLLSLRKDRELGARVRITSVLVRDLKKKRAVTLPSFLLTDNWKTFLEAPQDVTVEAMGGETAARRVILGAIAKKRHVVSSNKVVLAKFAPEILEAAAQKGVNVRFEASCGAGIPLLHVLHKNLRANRVLQIIGIVNGTTNYILSAMEREKKEFHEALQEAQEKGYAEPDPTDDIEGYDAQYKATLLALMGFGFYCPPEKIFTEGIASLGAPDLIYAREFGFAIKLLALLGFERHRFFARVHPCLLPCDHPLASISGVFNSIFVKTDAAGDLMFVGRGAGALPTASALLSDVLQSVTPAEPLKVQWLSPQNFLLPSQWQGRYYARMEVTDRPGVLAKIASSFGCYGVSIDSVIQKQALKKKAEIVWLTHEVKEEKMEKAMAEIRKLPVVAKVHSLLRVIS